MAYSTIPAATDQLLLTIANRLAQEAFATVTLVDGLSGRLPDDPELVVVDDADKWTQEWAQLGQFRIDESYTIKVHIETFYASPNDAPEHRAACRHRLFDLIAEVQQAAVLDVTLAGILNWGVKPNGGNPVVFPVDGGWLGAVTLNLECSGRIQPFAVPAP
jgi:hypothetical protein